MTQNVPPLEDQPVPPGEVEVSQIEADDIDQWRVLRAPSLELFEVLAEDAFARLPEAFRRMCAGIVLQVEDFPTDEVLEELEAETPFDLLGLFQGIGLAQGAAVTETGRLPNMVFLYRRPILDYWAEHEEELGALIAHVLIHEIGHHFGLSDDDMARIEAGVED